MSDEELLDYEREQSVEAVVEVLRSVASDLEAGDDLSIDVRDETVTVPAPEDDLEFELDLERETIREDTEYELELELEWITEE